jgi:hypothetical protein
MSKEIKEDIQRYKDLKSDRASFDTLWQKIADYVMPRKSEINTEKTEDTEGYVEDLFDMTATQANMTLAAGIMTNAVPPTERTTNRSGGQLLTGSRNVLPSLPRNFPDPTFTRNSMNPC